jgi:glycosyltransferase family protein
MTPSETIDLILSNPSISLVRFGDGEFNIMLGNGNGFQKSNFVLAERLRGILLSQDNKNCLICIPRTIVSLKNLKIIAFFIHINILSKQYLKYSKYLCFEYNYGDALATRFYADYVDVKQLPKYVEKLRSIWANLDLLIIEGKTSNLGEGNDLFDNAKSISKIITRSHDAFDIYDSIFNAALSHSAGKLVIVALGPTATVLAYDLSLNGVRCLDLGHVDLEYTWFKMRSKGKVPIQGKHINELGIGGSYIAPGSSRCNVLLELL